MRILALNTLILAVGAAIVTVQWNLWIMGAMLIPFAAFAVIATWLCTAEPAEARHPIILTGASVLALTFTVLAQGGSFAMQLGAILFYMIQAMAIMCSLRAITPGADGREAQ